LDCVGPATIFLSDVSEESMQPSVPMYHIFSGLFPETDVSWLESVVGFYAAHERMQRIAAQKPGAYFIYSTNIHAVLATIDSTPAPHVNEGAA